MRYNPQACAYHHIGDRKSSAWDIRENWSKRVKFYGEDNREQQNYDVLVGVLAAIIVASLESIHEFKMKAEHVEYLFMEEMFSMLTCSKQGLSSSKD